MDNYQVSARKYRPDTFRSVVGQKALTTTLQNAVRNGQLAHAYLFCGPRGVGKTTCARIFAKAINCLHPTAEGEACNECESCRAFDEQRSYNILELDAASNNSVDDIRALTEEVRIPPAIGKYKVYIIDEVHMLSTQAFNAFLKTLEEPPAHAVFILATTEKHKIIPTILSRCQIYDFHRIGTADIQEHLQYVAQSEGIEYEPQALNVIAMKADGGMRDALSIFDQVASFGERKVTYKGVIDNLNVLDYDYFFRLTDHFLQHQSTEALLLFDEILRLGFDAQNFVLGLASHFRDLLICKDPRSVKLLEAGEQIKENYLHQSAACPFDWLVWALKTCNDCLMQYATSRNKRLLVELCLIRLCVGDTPAPSDGKGRLPGFSQSGAATPNATSVTAPAAASVSSQASTQPAPSAQPKPSASAQSSTDAHPAATAPKVQATVPASQPAPQPAPAPQPQAAAKPATPSRHRPQSFSLHQSQETISNQPTEEPQKIEENEPFVFSRLKELWKEYAQTFLAKDPQLLNAMLANEPEAKGQTEFEFVVFHSNLEKRLTEIKPYILQHLQGNLHNTHIGFNIRVSEGDEKKLALTPQDQLKAMTEANPALNDLRKRLGLELG